MGDGEAPREPAADRRGVRARARERDLRARGWHAHPPAAPLAEPGLAAGGGWGGVRRLRLPASLRPARPVPARSALAEFGEHGGGLLAHGGFEGHLLDREVAAQLRVLERAARGAGEALGELVETADRVV